MKSIITGGGVYELWSDTDVEYHPIQGNHTPRATTLGAYQVVPADGVLSDLMVITRGGPGVDKSRTLTLYKNGADTGLTVTITNATSVGSFPGQEDTTHSVSVSKGDLICLKHTPTGTPTTYALSWCMKFQSDSLNQGIILGCNEIGASGALDDTFTSYGQVCTGGNRPGVGFYDQIIPTNGKLSALYVDFDEAPDPGLTGSHTLTIQNNQI